MSGKAPDPKADMSSVMPMTEQLKNLRQAEENQLGATTLADADAEPVPVDSLPANVPLPCSVYLKVGGKNVLFRTQGERMTLKRLSELTQRGASTFLVHRASWQVFSSFIEKASPGESASPTERAQHLRHLMLIYGLELERSNRQTRRTLVEKMHKHAAEVATLIKSTPAAIQDLLSRASQNSPTRHAAHALNAAAYAALIGIKLDYSAEDLKNLVFAVMIHDIGKLSMDKKLFLKTTPPTEEELAQIKAHPRLGAEMLQSYIAIPAVHQAVLQHHERVDGKGYPSGLKGEKIHPFARICAIADTFDSLTSDRPYRAKISAEEALKKMAADEGHFDRSFLLAVPEGKDEKPK
jgi:HD-GYP domain-containing protein (c-di-GMP phosphodiesterase class II)